MRLFVIWSIKMNWIIEFTHISKLAQWQIHNRFCLIVERSPDKVLPNRQKVTKIPCILKAHPILSNTLGCSGRHKSCYTVQWFSEINLFTWFAWNAWDTDIGILNSSLPLHLNLKPRTSTSSCCTVIRSYDIAGKNVRTKSLLISKCLFGVFNSSQKTNENKTTWGIFWN